MNPVEAMEYLRVTAMSELKSPYQELCLFAIEHYDEGYGGATHHHAYSAVWTASPPEVVQYCLEMAGPGMDKNVLLVAAYWHDYAKLNEYQCDISGGKIAVTEYRKTTGHVVGSSYALMYYLIRHKMDIPDLDPIVHCMLSHHGRREWGSPVEPATREAWTLHAADMLSSRGCE